ncbi:MAG TPA: hypothetical protein VNT32_01235 [Thermoleophilaceae bacterium]|nr:hypothetical protein [Thermoleophilaceae bacterium]
MSNEMIAIYLRDHSAIAAGGVALAQRAAANGEGTDFGRCAESLVSELERHDEAMLAVLRAIGARPSRLKRAGARLGERAGRLKLNGRVVSGSPLSPVTEAEGLLAVLGAHLLAWSALERLGDGALPAGVDAGALATSARESIAGVERHRLDLLEAAVRG